VLFKPKLERFAIKFFDEVRIDQSNMGSLYIHSMRNGVVKHIGKMATNSYTLNFLVFVDAEPGFIFDVVKGSSNSYHYTNFWLNTASSILHDGDTVIVYKG
jgi:hypothetical protein